MKDLFEYKSIPLIFGLLNGCDVTFEGDVMPTVINEMISNSFWTYFFNFDFLTFRDKFDPLHQCIFNITSKLIN